MTVLFEYIKNFVTPSPPDHPFKAVTKVVTPVTEHVEPDDIKSVNWGDNNVVKAKTEVGTDFMSWEQLDKGKTKLSPVDLDDYDMTIIRQKSINTNNYKLVKPYVVAGWSNEQIASVLGRSRSWVERLSPRVRDAAKLRNNPLP